MDSLTILFEAIDSLGIETDPDFKQPSFDLYSFTQAKPWQYGEKLFQAILNVRFYFDLFNPYAAKESSGNVGGVSRPPMS